jgi:hypothetical protein
VGGSASSADDGEIRPQPVSLTVRPGMVRDTTRPNRSPGGVPGWLAGNGSDRRTTARSENKKIFLPNGQWLTFPAT